MGKSSRGSVHRILKHETYAGTWHYGKRNSRPNGQWTKNPDDHLLTVKVPEIVSSELWKAAQARLKARSQTERRKPKYEYLMARHLTCGHCGAKMVGTCARPSSGKVYLDYRCPVTRPDNEYTRDCDAPLFRADQVDAAVSEWVKSFLIDPERLELGLEEYQEERNRENMSLRQPLAAVAGLIDSNKAQLERLLDQFLSGESSKEMLTDRKTRLKATIASLEKERVCLVARLEAQSLTENQFQSLMSFAAAITENLKSTDSFDTRRRIIEELDVWTTLLVENALKVAYLRCYLGASNVCMLSHTTKRGDTQKTGTGLMPDTHVSGDLPFPRDGATIKTAWMSSDDGCHRFSDR